MSIAWSEQSFEGAVAAVAVDAEHFVAAGRDADGLAAWTSSDGRLWERHSVPVPPGDFTLENCPGNWMGPLARLGGTLYSIGNLTGCGGDYGALMGWRSPDGVNWEVIESDNAFFASGQLMHLTASDAALVAVIENGLIAPSQNVWRWSSETSWTPTDLIFTTERTLAVRDLIWAAGRFVAVGATFEASDAPQEEWPPQPAAWVSMDGRAWEPMALPETMLAACAVAPTGDGGVLVLGQSPDGPAAWTSTEGRTWTDAASIDADSDGTCPSYTIAVEGGFLAALSSPGKLILATSRDGTTWAHTELSDVMLQSHRTAAFGDVVIAFTTPWQVTGEERTVLFRGVVEP